MATFFDTLEAKHVELLCKQPVFFVATAASDGRINLSPKGYDSLRVLAPNSLAYLDLGGSGNETHAHLTADGRITIMACNFDRPALILRIYGRGRPVLPVDAEWGELATHFTLLPGTRQIFVITVESVQESCGWGVPFMELKSERETLKKAHRQVPPDAWVTLAQSNTQSIDGLPVRATDRYFAGEEG